MPQTRREFFGATAALWAAAVARAQHAHPPSPTPAPNYSFVFFKDPELATLRALIARIVPADERSSGAAGARVDEYIDFILSHAEPALQQQWRTGIANYGASIDRLNPNQIDAFLSEQAANEFHPSTDGEHFFVLLKYAVTEGFYTSEEGINKELGYQGMTFNLDFLGCTHQQHEAPANWKPLLRQQEA